MEPQRADCHPSSPPESFVQCGLMHSLNSPSPSSKGSAQAAHLTLGTLRTLFPRGRSSALSVPVPHFSVQRTTLSPFLWASGLPFIPQQQDISPYKALTLPGKSTSTLHLYGQPYDAGVLGNTFHMLRVPLMSWAYCASFSLFLPFIYSYSFFLLEPVCLSTYLPISFIYSFPFPSFLSFFFLLFSPCFHLLFHILIFFPIIKSSHLLLFQLC